MVASLSALELLLPLLEFLVVEVFPELEDLPLLVDDADFLALHLVVEECDLVLEVVEGGVVLLQVVDVLVLLLEDGLEGDELDLQALRSGVLLAGLDGGILRARWVLGRAFLDGGQLGFEVLVLLGDALDECVLAGGLLEEGLVVLLEVVDLLLEYVLAIMA